MGENWPVTSRDEDPGLLWEAEAAPVKSLTISPSTARHHHETAKLNSASSLAGFCQLFVPQLLFGSTFRDCYSDQISSLSSKKLLILFLFFFPPFNSHVLWSSTYSMEKKLKVHLFYCHCVFAEKVFHLLFLL